MIPILIARAVRSLIFGATACTVVPHHSRSRADIRKGCWNTIMSLATKSSASLNHSPTCRHMQSHLWRKARLHCLPVCKPRQTPPHHFPKTGVSIAPSTEINSRTRHASSLTPWVKEKRNYRANHITESIKPLKTWMVWSSVIVSLQLLFLLFIGSLL